MIKIEWKSQLVPRSIPSPHADDANIAEYSDGPISKSLNRFATYGTMTMEAI